MKETSAELICKLKSDLRAILANRLTYPKAMLGVAQDRPLTQAESDKAQAHIDEVLRVMDAEFSRVIWKLEEEK